MQHLEEGEIHAWLDGALSAEESARVEQHAATCKECAAMVADARGFIAGSARIVSALDHVPSGVIPKSKPAVTAGQPLWRALRLTPFRAAMAASLLVAFGTLMVLPGGDKVSVPGALEKSALAEPSAVIASPTAAPMAPAPAAPVVADRSTPPAANAPVARQDQARIEARQLEQSPRVQQSQAQQGQQAQQTSKTTLASSDTTFLLRAAAPAAAPSAAKAAVAESDQRAKKESNLAAAVSTGVAGGSAVGARVDSVRAAAPSRARDAGNAADIAFRRDLPAAVAGLQSSRFADGNAAGFVGCYQVVDSASWPLPLPHRFSLLGDTASGAENVRVIGESSTGHWRGVSPTMASIRIRFAASTLEFSLLQRTDGLIVNAPAQPDKIVRVSRITCPR